MTEKFISHYVLLIVSALVLLYAPQALAGASIEISSVHACKAEEDDNKRLSCFDSLFSDLAVNQHAKVEPVLSKSATLPLEDQVDDDDISRENRKPSSANALSQFGAERLKSKRRRAREQSDAINAVAVEISRNRFGKYTVTLDNGQVWRQLQSDSGRLNIGGKMPSVRIKRGVFGSYTLKVPKSKRPIRVKRIK